MFDAKVTVLGEYIDHHVKEERSEMLPGPARQSWIWSRWPNSSSFARKPLMAKDDAHDRAKPVAEAATTH